MQRMMARATMMQIEAYGSGQSGYSAGKNNRFTKFLSKSSINENAVARGEVHRLRALSWDLYRNNSQAKKICRSLESKVIGRGLRPQSQATKADGTPHVEFRTAAHTLWRTMHEQLDYRGRPGAGGQDFTEFSKTALRGTILGGEVLFRFRTFPADTKLPNTKIQLIHADRLYDAAQPSQESANSIFYGIELDAQDRRAAYHFYRYHPSDPRGFGSTEVQRIGAQFVRHLYVAEDIDQLRGTPWFSAALGKMRDTGDYEFNELKAAAVAACVVLGYRRSSGQSAGIGLAEPENWDLSDSDGNKLSAMQPGMLLDLGRNGDLVGFNPQRPNANASEFIAHMLRSQATAVPGMKGSTLTGDFRNSSFSSERSADNDIWPEIEGLQDWFAGSFCQPIYEEVITNAVIAGWFDGVIDLEEFAARKDDFLRCGWQGPVARSINPVDDASAAKQRVQNGISTPQKECSLVGQNWQENILAIAEFIEFAKAQKIPQSIIDQMLGIEQTDTPEAPAALADPKQKPAADGAIA